MALGPPILIGARGPRPAYTRIVPVVASDTVSNPAGPLVALTCNTGGTASIVDDGGNIGTITLNAGVVMDLPPIARVNVTGTTAAGLLGFAG